ncbi:unnamed protein product [Amoebophrya sp. A120]|nr:unnamed protein product [Amoebophrya sp. A120]|eukprot:GSA120T00017848001.1
MAGPPELVSISPQGLLQFATTAKDQKLLINNVSGKHVCYKVKTTAPKSYVVRPSNDVLKPGGSATVKIVLQTDDLSVITQHRFMVQAVLAEGEENITKEQWTSMAKSEIQEFRLNVEQLQPGAATPSPAAPNAPASNDNARNIQRKYDELVKYTVKLEEETLELQREKEALEKQAPKSGDLSLNLFHMLLAVLVAVALSKLPQYM